MTATRAGLFSLLAIILCLPTTDAAVVTWPFDVSVSDLQIQIGSRTFNGAVRYQGTIETTGTVLPGGVIPAGDFAITRLDSFTYDLTLAGFLSGSELLGSPDLSGRAPNPVLSTLPAFVRYDGSSWSVANEVAFTSYNGANTPNRRFSSFTLRPEGAAVMSEFEFGLGRSFPIGFSAASSSSYVSPAPTAVPEPGAVGLAFVSLLGACLPLVWRRTRRTRRRRLDRTNRRK